MNPSLHFFAYGLEIKIESGTIILYKKKKVSVGSSNRMTFMEILEKNVNDPLNIFLFVILLFGHD